MAAKRMAAAGMMTALALALAYLEALVPLQAVIPLPGVRLGLANIVKMCIRDRLYPDSFGRMCFFRHLISPHVEGTSDKENEKGTLLYGNMQKGVFLSFLFRYNKKKTFSHSYLCRRRHKVARIAEPNWTFASRFLRRKAPAEWRIL